mgnify:CR=1 FL=1
MEVRKWFCKVAAGAIGAALLFVPCLRAGVAAVDVIGFSPDGHHFSFQQTGREEASGVAYSDLFIIDVKNSRWAERPFRYRGAKNEQLATKSSHTFECSDSESISRSVRLRAMSTLRKHDFTSADDGKVLFEDYTAAGCEKKSIALPSEKMLGQIALRTIPNSPAKQSSKRLEVLLKDCDGKETIIFKDEKTSWERLNATDYDISGAYLGGPEGRSLALVIGYLQEGAEKKYLAVTKELSEKTSVKASNSLNGKFTKYGLVKVNSFLNVRSGPGTEYDVIREAKNGEYVYIVNSSIAEWYGIDDYYTGDTSWVSRDFVVTRELEAVCIANTYLNVRQSPSTSAKIVGKLQGGKEVSIIGDFEPANEPGAYWYQIVFNGTSAWVSADYIEAYESDC